METATGKNKLKRVVVWFRHDLRLHDNEALHEALQRAREIIPVYIFDIRLFRDVTSFGFRKTGPFRAAFLIESVLDLKHSLQKAGSELIVRVGIPEDEIFNIVKETDTSRVFCNMERTEEELKVQNTLEQKLWTLGREINYFRGKMLLYTHDLPFPVTHTPDQFTQFRKEVEKIVPIRKPLPSPEKLPAVIHPIMPGSVPDMHELGYEPFKTDPRAAICFTGGETRALERLQHYFWDTDALAGYRDTRNGLLGADYSSKLSPWLAQGCISPKYIYFQLQEYEQKRKKNDSTHQLYFELLWRDFFRLMLKKYGDRIFEPGGTKGKTRTDLTDDHETFERWKTGKTGVPFIDANMTELNNTGFMSNRGRQNVASFLVNNLKVNWLMGAEYFESLLIDYDPASNYGNWNYLAGVGADPRENRVLNTERQAEMYDPRGAYVQHWLGSSG